MTARLTTLPDALRGGAWPSPARVVRCPVKSGKLLPRGMLMFTWWIYWLAGLWDADRGSTAKGVVSIKNKCINIIAAFIIISTEELKVNQSKIKFRVTRGYGEAIEAYYTSTQIRRMIEEIVHEKEKLRGNEGRAFLAGKIDGDGYIDHIKREIYIGYGSRNLYEALRDAQIVNNLGLRYSIGTSGNIVKLRLLRPKEVAPLILPFIMHPLKHVKLLKLLNNPEQGAERARPPPPVATRSSGIGAHWGDCRRLRRRKEGATAGQHAPKPPGCTRATMAGTAGTDPERGR